MKVGQRVKFTHRFDIPGTFIIDQEKYGKITEVYNGKIKIVFDNGKTASFPINSPQIILLS